jgi:hypothetical protein
VVSFLLVSHQNPTCIPLFLHSCYIPYPSNRQWIDHSNYTWRVKLRSSPLCSLSELLHSVPLLLSWSRLVRSPSCLECVCVCVCVRVCAPVDARQQGLLLNERRVRPFNRGALIDQSRGSAARPSQTETEYSELLYGWRFTANQFVLATSPLRLTTQYFPTQYLRF